MKLQFIGLILTIVILRESRAREAVVPIPDVGQIIKDLDGLHIDGATFKQGAPCKVNVQEDLPRYDQVQPLYLHPGTNLYWLPNPDGHLEVDHGASIELHCSNPFAPANGESLDAKLRSIRVKCVQDTTFEWMGAKIQFSDFVCSHSMPYTVERLNRSCGSNTTSPSTSNLYRVGYDTGDGRFVATMELCHDPNHLRTHYANHQLTPASVHFQKKVKRQKFSTAGHFTGFDMFEIYSQKNQEKLMVPGLIDVKSGLFLSRGHLTAKADLIYASQQRSSFNYMNVAPQWQSFNGGQWADLEDSTRKFVARSGITANVYTGIYGEMKVAGSKVLHLTTNADNTGVMPVPQLFYRVIIDVGHPTRGIALVGVNNPHATLAQIHESYIICDPVEEQVQWLSWLHKSNAKGNLKKGYLYACSVADLARAVGHLPRPLLEVDELLT
ncbi:uncharacterized protein LOC6545359 [Drosophila erecta]|uniref:DNA/RNA non-specific endonuclease/pyrophosphatase/phosphodiesterase domain-containing protein n=1 Tax=Drosophila erecta TaxID=7220 RepID=B3NCW4_DROER|nr:uncharacterized protein LOC6545359 [Drosophila erecta]EDV51620.1 uncharacterized protein Dere_GG15609 [Drosophila erecta]